MTQVNFQLPDEFLEELKDVAYAEHRSVSNWVATVVMTELKSLRAKQ
jgi:hypothetical protein